MNEVTRKLETGRCRHVVYNAGDSIADFFLCFQVLFTSCAFKQFKMLSLGKAHLF